MTSICILAVGKGLGFNWEIPKSLIILEDNNTILDFQMGQLKKHNLDGDVTIVLGWYGQKLIDYCRDKYTVKFIWDKTCENSHSITRTLLYIKDYLLTTPKPLIMIFCDQLWDNEALQNILNCSGDCCRIRWTHGLMKFTQKGIEEVIDIMETRTNNLGAIKVEMIERKKAVFTEILNGLMLDVDNQEHLNKARRGLWVKIRRNK